MRSDTKCAALLLRDDGRYPIDPPPYATPTPTRSAAAKFGRRSRSPAPGASGAAALGWTGEPEKAEPPSAGVTSRGEGDERIWTRSVVGLDLDVWIPSLFQ